ncbi:glycosyltransferase family protein [Neorhodopirellula pilleata]|uniref:Glycosyl transferases group 1 n=1 Tax=Neorhodopirellula pilleata TaxID=2714738 RepID=A0A5C6AVD5_9BACT|nr:glycosyltransferase family 4 protein [Neorhodopirellula pilleata]TWU03985.1 hypothetical protein Pla100_09210 [Neorhodopirellula pilleata]
MPILDTVDVPNSDESPIRAVAIVHCHFEPGGVTQVVQNHVKCLVQDTRVVLVSGPRTSGLRRFANENVAAFILDSLEYDSHRVQESQGHEFTDLAATEMFNALDRGLREHGLDPSDSIIHWHNHSLGKNAASPLVIARLAQAGWQILLQIHDFAEDQRPTNYRHLIEQLLPAETSDLQRDRLDRLLYPRHPRIHYAVLTVGDADVLIDSGIDATRVHLIPNSVDLPGCQLDRPTAMRKISDAFGVSAESRWLLYPVRGIRRKNIGEFLLWCQLLHRTNVAAAHPTDVIEPCVGALTLRPTTPVEAASYDRWHQVAHDLVPNVVFDAGEHPDVSFIENLAACHCVVSTSVAEGFGMAFLEPWLVDRRVIARDLPAVTGGFAREGLRLTNLYGSLWIPGPADWITRMNRRWREQAIQAWASVPDTMRPDMTFLHGSPEESELLTDRIDFARLHPVDQIDVIRRVSKDDAFALAVAAMNQAVLDAIESVGDDANIAHNRMIVESRYQADVQREQLHCAYRQTSTESRCHVENASLVDPPFRPRVIDLVNRSHPFYPCRVESL